MDDPRDSVERADSLLDEITTSLRTALETRTRRTPGPLEEQRPDDTEELRTALRDYRAMLEQLLTTLPPGQGDPCSQSLQQSYSASAFYLI